MKKTAFLIAAVLLIGFAAGCSHDTPAPNGFTLEAKLSDNAPADVKAFVHQLESVPPQQRTAIVMQNQQEMARIMQSNDETTKNLVRNLMAHAPAAPRY